MKPDTRNATLYGLFFASGATSLILELLWLRGFAILLGSTLYAMSCVLTAFTLGLALGSNLAERWLRYVERSGPRAPGFFVVAYGLLELVIGASGLLLTLVLFRNQGLLFEALALFDEGFDKAGFANRLFDLFPLAQSGQALGNQIELSGLAQIGALDQQ